MKLFRVRVLHVFNIGLILILASSCASTSYQPSNKKSPAVIIDKTAPLNDQPVARDSDDFRGEIAAVSFILDSAEKSLETKDFTRAISLTDRALRIQNKVPRAYVIAAKSYSLQGNAEKARQVAKQGLLYTPETSPFFRPLLKMAKEVYE